MEQMEHFPGMESDGSQALVAHASNPSYSGGRDQEDHGWKPDRAIVWETLSWKTLHKK
jgi:hypothetical protein